MFTYQSAEGDDPGDDDASDVATAHAPALEEPAPDVASVTVPAFEEAAPIVPDPVLEAFFSVISLYANIPEPTYVLPDPAFDVGSFVLPGSAPKVPGPAVSGLAPETVTRDVPLPTVSAFPSGVKAHRKNAL